MKKSNDIQSRRKQLKLRITIVILIFLLAAIGLGVHVVQNYIPSREHMSLTEYYGQPSDGEMVVVLGTDIMEERALKSGDQIYLPQTMVSTYLNQRYTGTALTSRFCMQHRQHLRIIRHQNQETGMSGLRMGPFI